MTGLIIIDADGWRSVGSARIRDPGAYRDRLADAIDSRRLKAVHVSQESVQELELQLSSCPMITVLLEQ